jgi:hypothetical protein
MRFTMLRQIRRAGRGRYKKLGDRFDVSPAIIWLQSLPARPSFSAISRLDEAL